MWSRGWTRFSRFARTFYLTPFQSRTMCLCVKENIVYWEQPPIRTRPRGDNNKSPASGACLPPTWPVAEHENIMHFRNKATPTHMHTYIHMYKYISAYIIYRCRVHVCKIPLIFHQNKRWTSCVRRSHQNEVYPRPPIYYFSRRKILALSPNWRRKTLASLSH